MTVLELIKELKKHDENLHVGGRGHFGELLNIEEVTEYEDFLHINIEDAGEEPD